jgi:hypothetical protein
MEVVLDIETDKVDATVIRLVGVFHMTSKGVPKSYTVETPKDLLNLLDRLNPDMIIGHNILPFDCKVLLELWGVDLSVYHVIDTLIMSKLADFNRPSHSLESYGKELGFPKGEISCYATAPIGELTEYLETDLKLTWRVYQLLLHDLEGTARCIAREMEVSEIMCRQRVAGITFDVPASVKLLGLLDNHMDALRSVVNPSLGEVPIPASRVKLPPVKQFKKDGSPSALAIKYFPDLSYNKALRKYMFVNPKSGSKTCLPHHLPIYTTEPLTLDMTSALKTWLIGKGWKPTLWNTKRITDSEGKVEYVRTSPKLYNKSKEPCPNLSRCGFLFAKEVAEFLTVRSRRNVVKSQSGTGGWLNNNRLVTEGKLTADADTMGANTGRFTHKIVANVPRVTSLYGKEMRSLFKASKGKVMVGWDASALEACMEGHYCMTLPMGKSHTDRLMSGKIHDDNAEYLGCSRDKAKEFKYAVTYGAQPPTLAETMGWPLTRAKEAYSEFWRKNHVLRTLKDNLVASWKLTGKRYIRGLDGRKIFTRSEHSLLNALFQSAGAIVMKEAMVIADREIHSTVEGAEGLIRYHDEEQWECDPVDSCIVGQIGVDSIAKAGHNLGMNVKLRGEYEIGSTWADTH